MWPEADKVDPMSQEPKRVVGQGGALHLPEAQRRRLGLAPGAEFLVEEIAEGKALMTVKRKVLFLCTGNSARSQMAEAIVNARMGGQWEAASAGTEPAGYVHPDALRALAEIGIEHEGRSKSALEFRDVVFDLVVTVCDSAAENCPVWLGKGKQVHLGFPDPALATGSDDEVMVVFRTVRDEIAERVPALLRQGGRRDSSSLADQSAKHLSEKEEKSNE